MNYWSGNFYLSIDEMKLNAEFFYSKMIELGWTLNSISGMLGNMQTESTINPAIWQNLDEGNLELGFGLVQWTPATKYIDWCFSNNLDINMMESQIARIEFEVYNNIQWIPTPEFNYSFLDFKLSDRTPEHLGLAFLANYERPANPNQMQRAEQARFWYDYLSQINPPKTRKGMSLLFYLPQS